MEHTEKELSRQAQDFITLARNVSKISNKKLSGTTYLSLEQQRAIEGEIGSTGISGQFNSSAGIKAAKRLLERFEELCRRIKLPVPEECRPNISRILIGELLANFRTFYSAIDKAEPDEEYLHKMVSLTLHQGISFMRVSQEAEFSAFKDMPWVFMRAAVGYPSDPRGRLRDMLKKTSGNTEEMEVVPQ